MEGVAFFILMCYATPHANSQEERSDHRKAPAPRQ